MTHRLRKGTVVTKGKGRKKEREFGMDMYILCLKWITNKDLLYSTGNSAQCYVAGWMVGEFGGGTMDMCLCMAESLCCAQHC